MRNLVNKITVDVLFCLILDLEKCLISTYIHVSCFSTHAGSYQFFLVHEIEDMPRISLCKTWSGRQLTIDP